MPTPIAILLGAGRPRRGTSPSALQGVGVRPVLHWLLGAFEGHASVHYVGGYHVADVAAAFPDLALSINTEWRTTGPVGSLFCAPLRTESALYISYTDVVYAPEVLAALESSAADVVVGVDRGWRDRYEGRSERGRAEILELAGERVTGLADPEGKGVDNGEFIGLARLSARAAAEVARLRDERRADLARASVPQLLLELIAADLEVRAVDVGADWAELDAPQDLSRFVLGTKAHTLARLAPMVRCSRIGAQVRLTVGEWRERRAEAIARVRSTFGETSLAVRSSALNEDSWTTANAGTFESVLNVSSVDEAAVAGAVERVIGSYDDDRAGHEVLVQEMVADVVTSGVAFTRTLSHGAPYYQINYDDSSSSTESVTSGAGRGLKMLFVHRSAQELPAEASSSLSGLLPALRELERLVGHDALDVEFAIDRQGSVHVLQSRPIVVDYSAWFVDDADVDLALDDARALFERKRPCASFVVGSQPMFGVMPDWNPAEIIGIKPRRLASSLYRRLITDEVWAAQRAEHGYRDVRPLPLITWFAGHPYVDIRASLSSFVPSSLPDELAARLVDHYLERLRQNPHLHDKVEFEVAFTCWTFDFERQAVRLRDAGFDAAEIECIEQALISVTRHAFERYERDLASVALLDERCQALLRADLPPLERALALIEDCVRYGTLAFAHLARGAFVAASLLRSMVRGELIDEGARQAYLQSLNTVAKEFTQDAQRVAQGSVPREAFAARYGHLRPGTYEITSPNYASDPARYMWPAIDGAAAGHGEAQPSAGFGVAVDERLAARLHAAGLPEDPASFDRFLRSTMEGRESAKFAFTRNLSLALDALGEYGASQGLTLDEVSHVGLSDFEAIRSGQQPTRIGSWLLSRSEEGAELYRLAQSIELPPLIRQASDFLAFVLPDSQPNFVSTGKITAQLVCLDSEREDEDLDLGGKVVMISQADPGYDWLFGHGIAGLVTCYGGANSHMAIRAAELGLPAAIGIGEGLFAQLSGTGMIALDCQNRKIEVVL